MILNPYSGMQWGGESPCTLSEGWKPWRASHTCSLRGTEAAQQAALTMGLCLNSELWTWATKKQEVFDSRDLKESNQEMLFCLLTASVHWSTKYEFTKNWAIWLPGKLLIVKQLSDTTFFTFTQIWLIC